MLTIEPQLVERYIATGQAKLIFMPALDFNPRSLAATEAAYCAGDQTPQAFWSMHDLLFERQGQVWAEGDTFALAARFAAELGLSQDEFSTCLDEGRFRAEITAQDQARRTAGIRVRPSFRIVGPAQPEGKLAAGAQPFETFTRLIREALGG